ncbi:bifunctional adenosylcobinamide kinase/adenosylcobinamide-phosphate guanylyltransferase [Metallococcus carri]|nr:bifunctional adenosylcobinamide kinase/adenosylcobinamide-phosphate guanylyltransferase [Metallococcus carri]
MRTLVTGGVRSGKSRTAEELMAGHEAVIYVAPAPFDPTQDDEWAARIAEHQARRPAHWRTVETLAAADLLRESHGPVLIDCLGTWLTGTLDELGAWQDDEQVWRPRLRERVEDLVAAWSATAGPVVAVTNEVGWGLVSEHRSGRIFADELGRLNARIAGVSDEVLLVVAGRVLRLP